MTQPKFTPGPWTFHPEYGSQDQLCYHAIRDAENKTIASTWAGGNRPNAHLIAAAPEMYEALMEWDKLIAESGRDEFSFDHLRQVLVKARKVIAKARGGCSQDKGGV